MWFAGVRTGKFENLAGIYGRGVCFGRREREQTAVGPLVCPGPESDLSIPV